MAQPLTTVAVACSIVPVMPSGPGAAQRFGDPSSVTRNVVASQALLLAAPEPMRKLRRSPRSTGTCGSVNGGTRVRGWYSAEEYRDHVRVCSIAAGVPHSLQPTSAARTTARCSGMRTRKSREKFHGAMLGYAATRASGSSSRRASRETPAGRTWCSSSSIRLRRKTITNEFQSAPRPTIRAARLGVGFSWNETTWNAASPVTEESRCPGRM